MKAESARSDGVKKHPASDHRGQVLRSSKLRNNARFSYCAEVRSTLQHPLAYDLGVCLRFSATACTLGCGGLDELRLAESCVVAAEPVCCFRKCVAAGFGFAAG